MKHHVSDSETNAPSLLDLRALCAVVDHGSITGAARLLGETKGSVSRRLTRLERNLGAPLLRRSPRLVQPTEAAAAFRARVGRALELLEEATAQLQHDSEQPHGHLRVTAPYDLATAVFAPHIASFSTSFPRISLELVLTDALLDFDAHQIDVALRASSSLRDSSLIARKLVDIRGALYASAPYLDRHGVPARLADLRQHRILAVHASRGGATFDVRVSDARQRRRIQIPVAIVASDFGFCWEAAIAGGGIAVLPTVVADGDVRAGRLTPVLPNHTMFEAATYLVVPATRYLPRKVSVFRDFLLEAFCRSPGPAAGQCMPG